MTDRDIDQLIGQIQEMAARIGCDFIPDPDKLLAFRCAQREARAVQEEYRRMAAHQGEV
jgi:hypothetical protein